MVKIQTDKIDYQVSCLCRLKQAIVFARENHALEGRATHQMREELRLQGDNPYKMIAELTKSVHLGSTLSEDDLNKVVWWAHHWTMLTKISIEKRKKRAEARAKARTPEERYLPERGGIISKDDDPYGE